MSIAKKTKNQRRTISPRTKAFADAIIADPTISHTEAYIRTHATKKRTVARTEASKTLAKPIVKIYMDTAIQAAKHTIIDLSQNSENETIRLKASQDILDRTEGKAALKTISETHAINVNMAASDTTADAFLEFMKQRTKT